MIEKRPGERASDDITSGEWQGRELGLNRPMGIASDGRGNMWIANSGLINLPCPKVSIDFENVGGSLSPMGADGVPVTRAEDGGFKGGGLTIPWGIAVGPGARSATRSRRAAAATASAA